MQSVATCPPISTTYKYYSPEPPSESRLLFTDIPPPRHLVVPSLLHQRPNSTNPNQQSDSGIIIVIIVIICFVQQITPSRPTSSTPPPSNCFHPSLTKWPMTSSPRFATLALTTSDKSFWACVLNPRTRTPSSGTSWPCGSRMAEAAVATAKSRRPSRLRAHGSSSALPPLPRPEPATLQALPTTPLSTPMATALDTEDVEAPSIPHHTHVSGARTVSCGSRPSTTSPTVASSTQVSLGHVSRFVLLLLFFFFASANA